MTSKPPETGLPKATTTLQEKERIDVEASRQKRLERAKAKYRDRGGIYKPKETNPLIDILLSKDVSGLSPSKRAAQRRRSSTAPRSATGRSAISTGAGPSAGSRRKRSVPHKEADSGKVENVAKEGSELRLYPPEESSLTFRN